MLLAALFLLSSLLSPVPAPPSIIGYCWVGPGTLVLFLKATKPQYELHGNDHKALRDRATGATLIIRYVNEFEA